MSDNKLISEIRIGKSECENIPGNSLPSGIKNKQLNLAVHRITMKLREKKFTLGNKDSLSINFTVFPIKERIMLSQREVASWSQYCDVKVSKVFYDSLDENPNLYDIVAYIEEVLVKYYSSGGFGKDLIHTCIKEAIDHGEAMTMKFKEKKSRNNTAIIFLRLLDDGYYYPLLRVYDNETNVLLEKELPKVITLDFCGRINLSNNKVSIIPRKNYFTKNLQPLVFSF